MRAARQCVQCSRAATAEEEEEEEEEGGGWRVEG